MNFLDDFPYPLPHFTRSGLPAKLERRGFVVRAKKEKSSSISAEFDENGKLATLLTVDVFVGLEITIFRHRGFWFWSNLDRIQTIRIGYTTSLNNLDGASLNLLDGANSHSYLVERDDHSQPNVTFDQLHRTIDGAVVTLNKMFDWLENNL